MSDFFDAHHHFKGLRKGILNVDFRQETSDVCFSIGLHPKDIDLQFKENLNKIKELSRNPNCVAIGECGLDSFSEADDVLQGLVFREQILWANEIQKPVIIHCVRRFSALVKYSEITQVPLIVHGFNKKKSIAEELLEKGFYLSFGKALIFNPVLQETARKISLDKIFLETDVWEGNVREVYEILAKIKNLNIEVLQKQIAENVECVFGVK